MTPQSAKAKGRRLQQLVCKGLMTVGANLGLQPGDIRSCSMGANGLDVILSPAAQQALGKLAIECKNKEALNVPSVFWAHAAKYAEQTPMLAHKKNDTDILITLRFTDYLQLLQRSLCAS